ncbi:hypothetical protein, partial [Amycolatopsis acidiphila]
MTRTRLAAAALTLAAAGLLVAGSFLPSTVTEHFTRGNRDQLLVTSWRPAFDPPLEGEIAQVYGDSHVPLFGIPLAVAAAVALMTRRWGLAAARTTVTAAAAGAAGVAFMLGMDVDSTLSYAGPTPVDATINRTVYAVGAGFWLIAGGALAALAAAVVLLRRPRQEVGDATPPQGFRPAGYGWGPGYAQPPQGYPATGAHPPGPGRPPASEPPASESAQPPG